MAPSRFVRLATLCAAIMCSAAALQLPGAGVEASVPSVEIRFKSETFPLERMAPATARSSPR